MFDGLSSLKKLDLNKNNVENIEPNTFSFNQKNLFKLQ